MIGFILGVICFILFIYFLSWYMGNTSTLSSNFADGATSLEVPAASISDGNATSYTFSAWIYVKEWSALSPKTIFKRGTDQPSMKMKQFENTVDIKLKLINGTTLTVSVENVPLQKWTNLVMTVSDQSLDVYLDGKLVKTKVLEGSSPSIATDLAVFLTPDGGFNGFTSRFKYWSEALNPQEVWNVYTSGPGGNFLTNFFGSYKLQLNFIKGTETKASITI